MRDDKGLAELYRAAITGIPGTGSLDPGRAREAVRRRRRRGSAVLAGVGAVVMVGLLVVLPHLNSAEMIASPPSPTPSTQPAMTVAPATAAPGSTVALYFPTGQARGIGFTLGATQRDAPGPGKLEPKAEERVDYYLTAGRDGVEPTRRDWASAGPTVDVGWPSVEVKGPGGDKVHIPEPAAPGEYRLCVAFATPSLCTTLTVR